MNMFRHQNMRLMYESCMDSGIRGIWLNSDGSQRAGSSHAAHFWFGYNGTRTPLANPNDREYRTTLGYAAYRAGQDFAKLS